jgi:hypothetical protein
VVLVVYYILYIVALKKNPGVSGKIRLLTLALIGLIYISYTLTLISDLAEKPAALPDLYRAYDGGFAFSPDFIETLFRWLHMISGAMAVAGIFMILLTLYHKKLKDNRDLLKLGSRSFLHGVILATLFGLIYLFTWDVEIIKAFLGSPGLHAVLGAIVLNIIALIMVFRLSKLGRLHFKLWLATILVFAGVFCMVIARHTLRLIYLEGHFDPASLTINPQWSVFLMFLVTFVIGLLVLFWMIRKYFEKSPSAE